MYFLYPRLRIDKINTVEHIFLSSFSVPSSSSLFYIYSYDVISAEERETSAGIEREINDVENRTSRMYYIIKKIDISRNYYIFFKNAIEFCIGNNNAGSGKGLDNLGLHAVRWGGFRE